MTPLDLAPTGASPSAIAIPGAYARCIAASKRVRWDIDTDVIRGRRLSLSQKYLPDGLSLTGKLDFLDDDDKRWLSQIQGRTYAHMFGLVERFIGAKVLELSRDHCLGDQVALEALIRFGDEELKHQELFRRMEVLAAEAMPAGYSFPWKPNDVAAAVLSKSSWAVLALTLHIELFTQAHYRESVSPDCDLSPLFKDALLYHWREEAQHAILDELEWRRVDATLDSRCPDKAVDEFIELVGAVDGILQAQARNDADYFMRTSAIGRTDKTKDGAVLDAVLKAYRWQYILSGARHPHFVKVLRELVTDDQLGRIVDALAPLT